MTSLSCRHQLLRQLLHDQAPLAVAFSGGVDSTLLLQVAHTVLGDRCIAVTVDAPYHFRQELADAATFTRQQGIRHLLIPFDPDAVPSSTPLSARLLNNPTDRCYLCKKALLSLCLSSLAPAWTVVDGSTLDDQTVHRPGRRALQELGIHSPLAEAGFRKQDIRTLSRELGLPTWDKPAQSCLLTRFPHNVTIQSGELARVEYCEEQLKSAGFSVVRVRSLGNLARLEFEQRELAQARLPVIEEICKKAGFTDIVIDPAGYRSGSMDQN